MILPGTLWNSIGRSAPLRAFAAPLRVPAFYLRAPAFSLHMSSSPSPSPIYGLPPGPFPVGVTTVEVVDRSRRDPGDPSSPRRLQTEIWYPAAAETGTVNRFSDFLGGGAIPGSIERANDPKAIGGYRDGLTVAELDGGVWTNHAMRDAHPSGTGLPLVLFSHGAGAFRASYIYWTEFLATHGYVVAAPDHPGSARYTQVGGKVITPGGARSTWDSMAGERPRDMIAVLDFFDGRERTEGPPTALQERLRGATDAQNVAMTGMSFGGHTTANVMMERDPRIKVAVLKCPALFDRNYSALAGGAPIMVMLGSEDTVIGNRDGNGKAKAYLDTHDKDSYLVEVRRGGHVSFTSCEIYNKEYGNGIGSKSPSLTRPGEFYKPLDIVEQHQMINTYGLAFLNKYLLPNQQDDAGRKLLLDAARGEGPFSKEELIIRAKI